MTIAVAAKAGATSTTSSGSLSVAVPSDTNSASNRFIVVVIAADNSVSGGATTSITGVSDSSTNPSSNTYTMRYNAIYDPGTTSAGCNVAIYTAPVTGSLVYGDDSISVGFSPNTTSKCMYYYVVTGDGTGTLTIGSGANGTGAATGSPTITTSSIPSGAVVFGQGAAESNSGFTGDSDTTNGSWSTAQNQTANTGTLLTSMTLTSQYKIVTAAGTQTYNPTRTSADCILNWLCIYEDIPASSFDPMGMMGYYHI